MILVTRWWIKPNGLTLVWWAPHQFNYQEVFLREFGWIATSRSRRLTQAGRMDIEFDWDPAKARENERKHGISFREGATAFADRLSLTIPDPDHSVGEQRFLLLGFTNNARLVVVSHTERGARIRLISVRAASSRERMDYEQNQP